MKFKDTRRTIYKSFESGNFRIENVPYKVSVEISDPIDEDLILSGIVMIQLIRIMNYMKENNMQVFDYENEID